jgi:hypothetical protein
MLALKRGDRSIFNERLRLCQRIESLPAGHQFIPSAGFDNPAVLEDANHIRASRCSEPMRHK